MSSRFFHTLAYSALTPSARCTASVFRFASYKKHCYAVRHISASTLATTRDSNVVELWPKLERPPLAALPTLTLLRSLLVATISSKPYLLGPSIFVLSRLAKPNRTFLFNVDRNPLLHWPLKRAFYRQFCAGENGEESRRTMQHMRQMGLSGTILIYAKETVFDQKSGTAYATGNTSDSHAAPTTQCAHVETWRTGTLQTVQMLNEGDQIAIKLTGAGPRANQAFSSGAPTPRQLLDAMDDICLAAQERGVRILIDAESQQVQRGIARLAVHLMKKYNTHGSATVYHTYQAYLKGTPDRLAADLTLAAKQGWAVGIKLVRGAYMATDQRHLIHNTKEETDAAYNHIAQSLLKQDIKGLGGGDIFPSVNLLLATHNKASALAALKLHRKRTRAELPTIPVQFAQLQGMSDEVSFSLLQMKGEDGQVPQVLKCSTWGTLGECLAYLVRRAIENRDAVARTKSEHTALKQELYRRLFAMGR